jgi:hypothetical protein
MSLLLLDYFELNIGGSYRWVVLHSAAFENALNTQKFDHHDAIQDLPLFDLPLELTPFVTT